MRVTRKAIVGGTGSCVTTGRAVCAVIALAAGWPAQSVATTWQTVHRDAEMRVDVDVDSVRREGPIAQAWAKFSYGTEQSFSSGKYRSNGMLVYLDCTEQRWAVKQGALFSGPELDGEQIFATEIPEEAIEWQPFGARGPMPQIRQRACAAEDESGHEAARPLSIRAKPPSEGTRLILGDFWSLYLDGKIDSGAGERLARVIAEKDIEQAGVYLNSTGGDVSAGMEIGRVIREAGFSTHVGRASPVSEGEAGTCYSACALAFAGGQWRYLDEDSLIGVHRFSRGSAGGDDLADAQFVSGAITRYLSEMGVSTDLFALMAGTPSDEIYVIDAGDARQLRLVNDGRGVPEWTIEGSEAGFYLRGVQDTVWGPGKVVLGCVSDGWMLMGFYSVTNAEEIAAGAVRASIRVDDEFVPLEGRPFYAKNGDVVGMASLDGEALARIRTAEAIGFAFRPANPDLFWGFAVDVGEAREKVERYFAACAAR